MEGEQSTPSSRRTTPPRHTPPRSTTPGSSSTPKHMSAKKSLPVFNSYMSLFQVQEKLKKGEVIEGVLRINPKNYEDAYISAPEGGMDIYIGGVRDRNAALHGDVVAVEFSPLDQWKVLHDVLDEYLKNNPEERSIVYSPLESTVTTSVATAASYNPLFNTTNTKPRDHVHKSEQIGAEFAGSHLEQGDSDVVVEEEEEQVEQGQSAHTKKKTAKKKKNRTRGKKTNKRKADGLVPKTQPDSKPEIELVVELRTKPVEIHDEMVVLTEATTATPSLPVPEGEKDLPVSLIVPPDQLSECESSDDESGSSEILDCERVADQAFVRDQWEGLIKEGGMQVEGQDSTINADEQAMITSPGKVLDFIIKQEPAAACPISNVHINTSEVMGTLSANNVNNVIKDNPTEDASVVLSAGYSQGNRTDVNVVEKMEKLSTCGDGVEEKCRQFADHKHIQDSNKKNRNSSHKAKQKETSSCRNPTVQRMIKKPGGEKPAAHGSSQGEDSTKDLRPKSCDAPRTSNDSQGTDHKTRYPATTHNMGRPAKSYTHRTPQHTPINTQSQGEAISGASLITVEHIQRISKWKSFIQRTARVVAIKEQKHTRMAAGTLKPFQDGNPQFALFAPTDHRVPRMRIPISFCPPDFRARAQDYKHKIFLAKIFQWTEPRMALGQLMKELGDAGDVEVETAAILLEYGVDDSPFPDTVLQDLPTLPWSIPEQELAARTDLREECIFTIDPSTARDLDDAMSCERLPSGNFRVGVHIADVSYFIPECTPLDNLAAERATSVYLTQKVIPMLPRVLCEHLCSLNPGEDRLAFSVIWEISPQGKVVGEWFGRTVIRSCVKLAYEHAQSMIEDPAKNWTKGELPEISGRFTASKISQVVNNLQSLAVQLRKKRFDDGALRLDQTKIAFTLDWDTKMPNGFYMYEIRDSNRLIEEFMLLANMAVAHKIYSCFPELAVLRRHPPPLESPMNAAVRTLAASGIHLDASNSGTLQQSIARYVGDDNFSFARAQVITNICSKPMQFARYFCTGVLGDETQFWHYALNVPLYTHFTSPIRRYADLLVHRLLAAAVDPDRFSPPSRSMGTLQKMAEHCNDNKQTSKTVQDLSSDLYLSVFIRQVKELIMEAMTISILDRSFDVLILKLGVIKRVYVNVPPLESYTHQKVGGRGCLTLHWPAEGDQPAQIQEVSLFSVVTVCLAPMDRDPLKCYTLLVRPT